MAKAPVSWVVWPVAASVTSRTTGTLQFSQTTRNAATISVSIARMMPFGMSRLGSTDSSAASGNCSMARKSQTAKGIVASVP